MHTLLSKYCDDFAQGFKPLLAPLQAANKALQAAPEMMPGGAIRPELIDLYHQVELLSQKVGAQQAYVLIFGPLKSGKSTLMNAISAEYVSEVTSLPAYPCMVYVSHAPEMHYVLTRYDGEKDEFRDDARLHAEIGRAHALLADKIREVEGRGEVFDPQLHFPEAIRRIDVKVPAGDLEQSAAVLVDTPGLYSRMKFGYDRMTREFRNAAACAVFVVKSDNLFLEQAFDEFHQLLELFSKVFLIVNLDLNKRDLKPDGTLAPSLESENPESILEAFETLAMSSPLKKAAADGRLQIFPVGLLDAASQRLRAQRGQRVPDDAKHTGFDEFRASLTEYLNSPDYMVAFLGDSLRHANTLLAESSSLLSRDAVRELERSVKVLEDEDKMLARKLEAQASLAAFDWRASHQKAAQELSDEYKQRVREVERKASAATDGALEAWFSDPSSLAELNDERFTPIFRAYQEELAMTLEESLRERIRQKDAGLGDVQATAAARELVGVDLDVFARRALESIDRSQLVIEPKEVLAGESIPVRRRLRDWLSFRSTAKLRDKLFGSQKQPTRKLSADVKRKRLGKKAKASMRAALTGYRRSFLQETFQRQRKVVLAGYAKSNLEALAMSLRSSKDEFSTSKKRVEAKLEDRRAVLRPLKQLAEATRSARDVVKRLSADYSKKSPKDLLEPVVIPAPLEAVQKNKGFAAPHAAVSSKAAELTDTSAPSEGRSESDGEQAGAQHAEGPARSD